MEYRVRKRNIDESSRGAERLENVLTDAVVRRFLLRAGFTTTTARTLEQTRTYVIDFLGKLLDAAVVLMGHHNRRTILLTDVVRACRHYGIRLYGYDDMCVLEGPSGVMEYHVTEMVEVGMTFNRAPENGEPDHEPAVYYQKTDFAQNQQAWDADDEDEDDSGDDSEWSWYSDSDADSDDDSVCEDEEHNCGSRPATVAPRWRRKHDPKQTFLRSLQAAQAVVDDELLVEPESKIMEFEAPLGQGYESDCDSSRVPASHRTWMMSALEEEGKWETTGNFTEYAEGQTESASENDAMEDESSDFQEDLNQYVISRQAFMDIFHAILADKQRCSLPVSAVALSALHNVSEQYLHAALTAGTLRAQIVSTMMEEKLEATFVQRAELEAERQKLQDVEATMIEMQATFQLKEQEMQRQIAELQTRLRQQMEEPVEDVDMETKPRASPGKRKASSKDEPVVMKQKASTSSSIVGSLRSRLHDYSLRKKAKISPI